MTNKEQVKDKLDEHEYSLEDTVLILSFDDLDATTPEVSSYHVFDRENKDYVLDDEGRKLIFRTLGGLAMFVEFGKEAKQNPSDSGNYYYDLEDALDRNVHRYQPSEISGV